MKKLPTKLKIGAHLVTIDASKELPGKDGEWDTSTNTIYICKTLAPSQKGVALFHEIFHAFNSEFDEGDKHIILESFAQQLYQVLSDNNLLR